MLSCIDASLTEHTSLMISDSTVCAESDITWKRLSVLILKHQAVWSIRMASFIDTNNVAWRIHVIHVTWKQFGNAFPKASSNDCFCVTIVMEFALNLFIKSGKWSGSSIFYSTSRISLLIQSAIKNTWNSTSSWFIHDDYIVLACVLWLHVEVAKNDSAMFNIKFDMGSLVFLQRGRLLMSFIDLNISNQNYAGM